MYCIFLTSGAFTVYTLRAGARRARAVTQTQRRRGGWRRGRRGALDRHSTGGETRGVRAAHEPCVECVLCADRGFHDHVPSVCVLGSISRPPAPDIFIDGFIKPAAARQRTYAYAVHDSVPVSACSLDMQKRKRENKRCWRRRRPQRQLALMTSSDHPNCSSGVASFPPQSYSRYVTCSSAAGLRSASASAACFALSWG